MRRSPIAFIIVLLVLITVASSNAAISDDPVQRTALIDIYDTTDCPNWEDNYGRVRDSTN